MCHLDIIHARDQQISPWQQKIFQISLGALTDSNLLTTSLETFAATS